MALLHHQLKLHGAVTIDSWVVSRTLRKHCSSIVIEQLTSMTLFRTFLLIEIQSVDAFRTSVRI